MDISDFDVNLCMDWLTAHRVVIGYDSRRITAYKRDGICVTFQGEKHDALTQTVHDSRWSGQLMGWLASLTLEDEVRQDLSLPRVVWEYEDVFPDELQGLPSHRDVDFVMELHLGTSPISMTPHRMAPVELHHHSRSNCRNYWIRVLLDRALHNGALRFLFAKKKDKTL